MKAYIQKFCRSRWSLRALLLPVIGAAMMAGTAPKATADLTIDLRAVSFMHYDSGTRATTNSSVGNGGGSISVDGKAVSGVVAGDLIAFDVYAQITTSALVYNASLDMNVYEVGMANVMGSILSSNGTGLTGSTGWKSGSGSTAKFNASTPKGLTDIVGAWKSGGTTYGTSQDLNADGSQDLGSNGTDINSDFMRYGSDLTKGDSAYSRLQMTMLDDGGWLAQQGVAGDIHDSTLGAATTKLSMNGAFAGIEMKLGQVGFTVVNNGGSLHLNWTYATTLLSGRNNALAFYDGMGSTGGYHTGLDGAAGTYHVGADVVLQGLAVPEPGTWAMLVGGLGMLALGRRRRRL